MGILGFFGNKKKDMEEEEKLKKSDGYIKRYKELDNLLDLVMQKSETNSQLENNNSLKGIRVGKYEMTSIPNEENVEKDNRKKLKFFLKDNETNNIETFTFLEKIFNYEIYFDKKKQRHLPKDDDMLTKQSYQAIKERYASNFLTRLEDVKREYCINENFNIEDNIEMNLGIGKTIKKDEILDNNIENIKTDNTKDLEIEEKIEENNKEEINKEQFDKEQEENTNNEKTNTENVYKGKIDKEKEKMLQREAIYKYGDKYSSEECWYSRYNELRTKFGMCEVTLEQVKLKKEKRRKAGFQLQDELSSKEKDKLYKVKLKILETQELCVKNDMKLGDINFSQSSLKTYEELNLKNGDTKDTYNFKILGETNSGEVRVFNIESYLKLGQDNFRDIMKPNLENGFKGAFEVKRFINKYNKTDSEKINAYRNLKIKNKEHIKNLLVVGDNSETFFDTLKELQNLGKNIKKDNEISAEEKEHFIKERTDEVVKNIIETFEKGLKLDDEINDKSEDEKTKNTPQYEENTNNEMYKILCKVIGKKQLDEKIYDFTYQALSDPYANYKSKDNIKKEEKEFTKEKEVEKNNIDEVILDEFEM